jgi:peptidoglycan/LPS O-acetylase OafA/YrhL
MESFGTLAGCALMMAVMIAIAASIARSSTFYRRELAVNNHRELPLDGLRGLAALMVAGHHAALCRTWLETGDFGNAHSWLPQNFGPIGVILFFMLTGYLFWGKARAGKGWLNPLRLWRGRIYRIAPLYFFSLILILIVATVDVGGQWLSATNWSSLLRLLGLGAWRWHAVGNMYPGEYAANVIWTLWFEWRFYLILPFIAWLALGPKIGGLTFALYVLVAAGFGFDLFEPTGLYFILGMLCSELIQTQPIRAPLQRPMAAAAAILTGAGLCYLVRDQLPSSGPSDLLALACFPVFMVVAAGNMLFGLLVHPAIRCLGAISFSLYLLHGIVFIFVSRELKRMNLNHLAPLEFWLSFTAVAIGITCLCAATYRWIEFPFLSASHRSRNLAKNTR